MNILRKEKPNRFLVLCWETGVAEHTSFSPSTEWAVSQRCLGQSLEQTCGDLWVDSSKEANVVCLMEIPGGRAASKFWCSVGVCIRNAFTACPSHILSIRFYVFSTSGNQSGSIDICLRASKGKAKTYKAVIRIQRWPGWAIGVCPSSNQGKARTKRGLAWLLKEFGVRFKKQRWRPLAMLKLHWRGTKQKPTKQKKPQQQIRIASQNSQIEIFMSRLWPFSYFDSKNQMQYLGNGLQVLQMFS